MGRRPEAGTVPPPATVGLALLAALGVAVDVLLGGPLTSLDHAVSEAVRDTGIRASDPWQPLFWPKLGFFALTQLGAREAAGVAVAAVLAVVSWRRRTVRPLVRLAVLGLLLVATVSAVKLGVGRTAPPIDQLRSPEGRSFPSGHTAAAVVLWGLLAWTVAGPAASRLAVGLARVLRWLAPSLTAAGMVVLDYHWLTDVVAGAAMGVLLLRVAYDLERLALRHWPGVKQGSAAGDAARAAGRPGGRVGAGPDRGGGRG